MAAPLTAVGGIFAAKTQTTLGTFPTIDGTNVINVVGTPSWKTRGAGTGGLIARADLYTDRGGGQFPVRGKIGWDITFQTELYLPDPSSPDTNPLMPLFRACMVNLVDTGADFHFYSTAQTGVSTVRTNAWDLQPVSLQWQQLDGRTFQAVDCVGTFKFSATAGEKVMIDWTFKGKWNAVPSGVTAIASADYTDQQAPIIFANSTLTLALTAGNTASFDLQSFEYDSGVTLSDVDDALATYGFGIATTAFADYPKLVVDIASQAESAQSTWTNAFNVTPTGTPPAPTTTLLITVGGGRTLTFQLRNSRQLVMPEETEANTMRRQKLTFVGIASGTAVADQASAITFA